MDSFSFGYLEREALNKLAVTQENNKHTPIIRSPLLMKMIQTRNTVRVICAPPGFGKTTLVQQYINIVAERFDICEIDASQPPFFALLTEPDARQPWVVDDGAKHLVVLDNVPKLSTLMEHALVGLVDQCLQCKAEVIVVSDCWRIAQIFPHSSCITAFDLLLGDEELCEVERQGSDISSTAMFRCDPITVRIPSCCFEGYEGRSRVAGTLITQNGLLADLPDNCAAYACVMLLLQNATFAQLGRVIKALSYEELEELNQRFPFVGLDIANERFNAFTLDTQERLTLIQHFPSHEFVQSFSALVDILYSNGACDEAFRLLFLYGTEEQRRNFARTFSWDIINSGCPRTYMSLLQRTTLQMLSKNDFLMMGYALSFLDKTEQAYRLFYTAYQQETDTLESAYLALCCLRTSESFNPAMKQCFIDCMKRMSFSPDVCTNEQLDEWIYRSARKELYCYIAWSYLLNGTDAFLDLCSLIALCDASLAIELVLVFLEMCAFEAKHRNSSQVLVSFAHIDDLLTAVLVDAGRSLKPTLIEHRLYHVIANLYQRPCSCAGRPEVSRRILSIENTRKKDSAGGISLEGDCSAPQNAVGQGAHNACAKGMIPSISFDTGKYESVCAMRLFGGFSCRILNGSAQKTVTLRSKAQVFMALLVLRHGTSLSREWVSQMLWPDKTEEQVSNSFYSMWSYITRELGGQRGESSFITKSQFSIYLRDEVVLSDVAELEKTCSYLEQGRVHDYKKLLSNFKDLYRGELMPGVENQEIVAARHSWQHRICHSSYEVAAKLVREGSYDLALSYLDFAQGVNPVDEDVCVLQAETLCKIKQHFLAMERIIQFRHRAADRYALEGSSRLNALYEQILREAQ